MRVTACDLRVAGCRVRGLLLRMADFGLRIEMAKNVEQYAASRACAPEEKHRVNLLGKNQSKFVSWIDGDAA